VIKPSSAPTRYRFVVEAVLLPLQIAVGLNFFAPAPLFPQIISEFGVERATVSLLVSAVTLMLAIFAIPGGIIAARIGLKPAIFLGGLLGSAGLLAPLATDFGFLMALRVLTGLGAAILVPITGAIVMQWFSPKETPIINGLNLMGQSFGVSLSFFFGVAISQGLGGWAAPLAVYGGIALISALGWGAFGRTRKGIEGVAEVKITDVMRVLPQRNTLLLGFAIMGPFAQYVALSTWLPTFYQEVRGMGPGLTSLITGILPFVGMGATLAGGILPARVGLRKPFLIVPGALIGLAGVASFITGNIIITVVGVMVLGVLSWVFVPTIFTVPMELPGTSPEKVGVILGAALAMGNFSSFWSPLIVGALTDRLGTYFPGFIIWAVFSSSLLISALLLPETGPRARERLARQATATAPG